jgi:hypothetical protein
MLQARNSVWGGDEVNEQDTATVWAIAALNYRHFI